MPDSLNEQIVKQEKMAWENLEIASFTLKQACDHYREALEMQLNSESREKGAEILESMEKRLTELKHTVKHYGDFTRMDSD